MEYKNKKRKDHPLVKEKKVFQELLNRFLDSEHTAIKASRIILGLVALSGVMVVAAMAPNIFSAFKLKKDDREYDYNRKRVQESIYYLRKKKLVTLIEQRDGKTLIKITKHGIEKITQYAIRDLILIPHQQWDRKWRVVVFDIPERFRKARVSLGKKLKELGFFQFQRSVFIYPYPAEDEILFIAAFFGVEQYVEILTVDQMLHDEELKKFFKL